MALDIRLLKREEIEAPRWNGCVHYAHNSRTYGYTWFLDNTCEEWMGLVEGNYESVFPLVFNKKYGISYLAQPFWAQQLGLFSVNVCSAARLRAFLEAIPAEFRRWNIQLNDRNLGIEQVKLPKTHLTMQPNYLLDLRPSYEEIETKYHKNLKRNLRKAEDLGVMSASNSVRFEDLVDLMREYHEKEQHNFPASEFHALLRIMYQAQHRGLSQVLSTHSPDGELLAAAFLLHSPTRIVNLCNVSTELGKTQQGMAALFDSLIRHAAGQSRILDFEGSRVPGVARFYASFGAENVPYPQLIYNNLPWPLSWLKRN